MSERNEIWNELSALLTKFEEQKKQIYVHYQGLVSATLDNRITSEREIEAIMDGLLDFCDDEKFLELYKKLCRHVYNRCPVLVGEHVNLFRLQFEENTDQ